MILIFIVVIDKLEVLKTKQNRAKSVWPGGELMGFVAEMFNAQQICMVCLTVPASLTGGGTPVIGSD